MAVALAASRKPTVVRVARIDCISEVFTVKFGTTVDVRISAVYARHDGSCHLCKSLMTFSMRPSRLFSGNGGNRSIATNDYTDVSRP